MQTYGCHKEDYSLHAGARFVDFLKLLIVFCVLSIGAFESAFVAEGLRFLKNFLGWMYFVFMSSSTHAPALLVFSYYHRGS